MTNYLITPEDLVGRAMNVKGFRDVYLNEGIGPDVVRTCAEAVAAEWTNDWSEDEGFGSSDATYMVREFILDVFIYGGVSHKYQVYFTPTLEVKEYSEADHHAAVERMESGI